MKKFLGVVTVGSLLFSSLLFASFSGRWSGEGVGTFPSHETLKCAVSFEFNQSEKNLVLVDGSEKCGDIEYTFNSVTLNIINGKLMYDDLEIGTISDEAIHIFFQDPNVTMSYDFLKRNHEDETPYIEYHEHTASEEGVSEIHAHLMK